MQDKALNSKCPGCNIGLNWVNKKLIMLEPCEHMYHKSCYTENSPCVLCKTTVTKTYTRTQLAELKTINKNYYQKYIDVTAIENFNYMSKYNKKRFLIQLPHLVTLLTSIPFYSGFESGHKLCKQLMNLMKIKIIVEGSKNIKPGNKVIIANHTIDIDFLPIFYIFKCGFLSSSVIYESFIGQHASKIIPLAIINRKNKNQNTVDKLKKYVEKFGSICLFPEGLMCHPDTLIQFRSGAFNIGYPICPVVLSYEPIVNDSNMGELLKKVLSQQEIIIKVKILEQEYPPFTPEKIEEIRHKIAKANNLALSRVSNRDIIDKT
jgi:1-acyl-sn-glycerol-3-phosphate acyltransferase